MRNSSYLQTLRALFNTARENSIGSNGVQGDRNTKPVFLAMQEHLLLITQELDVLNQLGIFDKTGNKIRYGIKKDQYGEKNPRLCLDIFFGSNLAVGIMKHPIQKNSFQYVYDGKTYDVKEESQVDEMLSLIYRSIAIATYRDILNKNTNDIFLN